MSEDEHTKPTLVDKPGGVARTHDKPVRRERYTEGDEIARGGMGRVVEATDTLLGRVVAMKQVLTLDPELLRRFARETKITARLEHPSIVPLYDAGTDGDAPFYVMRRVSGRPLAELIADTPTLAGRLALVPHVLAAAQAVAHAHQRGIVHRDIKPANILVGELGETVVIDWGLAKVIGEDDDEPAATSPTAADSLRTRVGAVVGTPGFMSASQLRGDSVGPPSDVYALGATLYFTLSGKPPHHAPTGDAMMMLAAQGPPTPLATLVPGVPRELSTIVETALAFGDASYPDAGAFAEDLRRFSTGQLVASHTYSTRERLWRFVRRHRGAVGIGLVAIAVIAIVGVISIGRILTERDRADESARAARLAVQREHDRADQLLLLRAGILVDTNATEAIAVLKDLDPSSPRAADAHAIANTATMRGVAWAMPGPAEFSTMLELDSGAHRLLQVVLTGEVCVWDLEKHQRLWTKQLTRTVRAVWIGGQLFIHGSEAPALIDGDTGVSRPLDLPRILNVDVSDDETSIVGTREDGELVRLDLAARTARPLWPGHRVHSFSQPSDGSWVAAQDGKQVIVLDRQGVEVLHLDGQPVTLTASRSHHLTVLDGAVLREVEVGPGAAWRTLDTSRFRPVLTYLYSGESLIIELSSGQVLANRKDGLVEIASAGDGLEHPHPLGDHELVGLSGTHELVYLDRFGFRHLGLPEALTTSRLTARRGHRRVAISAANVILVIDLDTMPHQLPRDPDGEALLIDEHVALLGISTAPGLHWFDIDSNRDVEVEPWVAGENVVLDVDSATGRVLITGYRPDASDLAILTKGEPHPLLIRHGTGITAGRLIPGGALFAVDRRVFVFDGTTRELARLPEPVGVVCWLGGTRYAALSVDGELVRGDLAGGPVELLRIEEGAIRTVKWNDPNSAWTTLVADDAGHALIGWGKALFRWTDRLETVATVPGSIEAVVRTSGGALVNMRDAAPLLIDLATGADYPLPPQHETLAVSADRAVLAFAVDGTYRFMDSVTHATWTTVMPGAPTIVRLSPSGRRALMVYGGALFVWQIPRGSGPLLDRLERLTNATVSSQGLVHWPWQH